MAPIPFFANVLIASVGAMILVATEFKALGVLLLTANGLIAILCALTASKNRKRVEDE